MFHTRSALLLGCGYVAKATAPLLAAQEFQVTGTTRSPEKAAELDAAGLHPLVNPDVRALKDAMAAASHILVSAPPGETGDPFLELFDHRTSLPNLDWLGYLSTTGIYGDARGEWVDEFTPPNPADERSRRRLVAEQDWCALSDKTRIFRLAGIYGPGRSALERVRDGSARRIIKPGQVFSRIHVDDIATALMASISRPDVAGPFNLADDLPAPQADVVAFAAELLRVEPPPLEDFETAEMSAMLRSFYAVSRRVSSETTRKRLGWTPTYPTYRDGLRAIYAASI
ncbi:MAG: NAD(P)-dependent oxidoreductase [Hyphobacterium sp.]|nr:MAG: NAD(P)-dependent oxidoreductase [Hyphobacterium sp.]